MHITGCQKNGAFHTGIQKNQAIHILFVEKRGPIIYLAALKKGAIRHAHPYHAIYRKDVGTMFSWRNKKIIFLISPSYLALKLDIAINMVMILKTTKDNMPTCKGSYVAYPISIFISSHIE